MNEDEYEGIFVSCDRCNREGYTQRINGVEGIPDGWARIEDKSGRMLLCFAHAVEITDVQTGLKR